MSSSPAAGAVGAAGVVIAVALAVQAAASIADAWPELVLAALGGALGAGIAINAIGARDLDPPRPAPAARIPTAHQRARSLAIVHQLCAVVIVSSIVLAGGTENPGWWLVAPVAGIGWAWTLWRMTWQLDTHPPHSGRSAYPQAFQIGLLATALWLIYGAMAADTHWLWRPERWDEYQGPIWLVVLELAGLPITLLALARPVR